MAMADFDYCFEKTLNFEGGYVLTETPHDRGGMTYAGISRKAHPDWIGWGIIDMGGTPVPETVQDFYILEFWHAMKLDHVQSNSVAWPVYDFAVTSGIRTSARMAQRICNIKADGIVGRQTIDALNWIESYHFKVEFALNRIRFYWDIAKKDKTQRGFLFHWIERSIAGI